MARYSPDCTDTTTLSLTPLSHTRARAKTLDNTQCNLMADASTGRVGAGEESAGGGVCSSSSKPAASGGGRSSCERRDNEVRRKREDRVLKRAAELKVIFVAHIQFGLGGV